MKTVTFKKWLGVCLSVLIALMPYSGFPSVFKNDFYVIAGLILAVIFMSMTPKLWTDGEVK